MSVSIKTAEEIDKMRIAGRLASELLDFITPHVRPGVTTGELDRIAHDYQVNVQQVVPATPELRARAPAVSARRSARRSITSSAGIPSDQRKAGDIVNIDITVIKDGFHGDTSRMFYVGTPPIQAKRLCEVTYAAMWRGIREVKAGASLGDIGATIQRFAEGHGFSVVREFCGHGIGRRFHEEPQVLHYGKAGTGWKPSRA